MSCVWIDVNFIYTSRPIISPPLSAAKLARTSLLRVQKSWNSNTDCRNIKSTHCYGCQFPFPPLKKPSSGSNPIIPEGPTGTQRFVCPSCHNHFCIECDLYCHEVLHNCPGCERFSQSTNGTQNGQPNGVPLVDSNAMIID